MRERFLMENYQTLKSLLPGQNPEKLILGPDSPWGQDLYLIEFNNKQMEALSNLLYSNAERASPYHCTNEAASALLERPGYQTLYEFLCKRFLASIEAGNVGVFLAFLRLEPNLQHYSKHCSSQFFAASMEGAAKTSGAYALNHMLNFAKQILAQKHIDSLESSLATLLAPCNSQYEHWSSQKQYAVVDFLNIVAFKENQRGHTVNYDKVFRGILVLEQQYRQSFGATARDLAFEASQSLRDQFPIVLQQITSLQTLVSRNLPTPSSRPQGSSFPMVTLQRY
jgi:hypothetical protein